MKLFSDFLKMIFKKGELNYFFRSVSISLIIIFIQFYKNLTSILFPVLLHFIVHCILTF